MFIRGTGPAKAGVQTISELGVYQGTEFKLRADARVRVQRIYKFVLNAGAKAKSVTNNLPILSVLALVIFNLKYQR